MKLSLRNLAMGAALAVSSLAFAQEMPFTVTENFNRGVTNADFGEGVTLGNSLRCATGYNGVIYALDKGTGTVYSIVGDEVKEFAKVDVNHGDNADHVSTAITTDDAGNIIIGYANGDFFANAVRALAIIPAGGGDVIYTAPLEFPEGYTPGRCDVFGRIVGDVLSEEGAYFFLGGDGAGKTAACFYAANGEFTAEEYASAEYKNALTSMNTVVPPFSTFAEVADCDPIYNAGVMTPWNASGPEIIVDAVAQNVGRPEGLAYSAVPGADVFTYEGKTYYVIPYTRTAGKRSGDFVIYDEDLNILFKTENTATDEFISGGFLNGGCLTVHPVAGKPNEFDLSFWGGPTTQVMAASYTIAFPAPEDPWIETGAFKIRPTFNRGVTNADFGEGVTLGNSLRCATGYNGVIYALDKGTGTVYSIVGDEVKEFAKVDVNHGDNADHVSTAITTDDAGNIIIGYANGDFFANAVRALAIIPAGGGDVIYTAPLEFPEGYTPGRCDVFGRIVGDVLSEEGAYFFLGGDGAGKTAACFYAANGEFTAEEYASAEYKNALTSMNTVVPPFSTFAEVADCDPIYNAGVMTPWNASGPEIIVDAVAQNVGRPEGLAYSAVPGADVFTYEGKTYYVIPYTRTAGKRSGDFVIYDEDLNILFKTENTATDEFISGGFLNGGCLTVHPVAGTDNKFELAFWGGPTSQVMAAIYQIEFPEVAPEQPKDIYVLGSYNNWAEPSAANADQFVKLTETAAGSNVYTGSVEMAARPSFRFISELAGWEAPQYGAQADDAMVAVALTNNTTYEGSIVAGKGAFNFNGWLGGSMDLTVDLTAMTVKAVATTPIPALAVRGSFDEWGAGVSLTAPEAADAEGKFVYTAEIASLPEGEIKIGQPGSWAINFGGNTDAALENGKAEQAWFDSSNNYKVAAAENVTVTFTLNPDLTQPSELMLNWKEAPVSDLRSAFAYDLKFVGVENGTYTVSYTASAEAAEAYINLYAEGSEEPAASIMLDAPLAGENTATFEATDVPEGKYTWAIVLLNEGEEQPTLVVNKVGDPAIKWGRGGVVTITDPEYASFGYTIVANSRDLGIDVYAPNGELVGTYDGKFPGDRTSATYTPSNSCPLRGDQRYGKAILASWGDPNSGLYAFDPLAPESGAQQIVEGDRDSKGIFTYNGVKTVSSTPCVAFVGKGEETMMWTFDEDIWSNQLVAYPIGDAETVTVPASIVCNTETCGWDSKETLKNTAVCLEPATNGFFASQNRANGMDNSIFSFVYVDKAGKLIANSYDLMTAANFELPSCNGAIALSKDEKILAVGSYNGVHFFNVTWTDNVPSLEHFADVNDLTTTKFTQAKFDAGNNLHIAGVNISDYSQQFYAVIALPGENYATTNAKGSDLITIESGVENIAVDAADADAVYYNLNGVRVAADELTPGIYVKVAGTTATKVVVK